MLVKVYTCSKINQRDPQSLIHHIEKLNWSPQIATNCQQMTEFSLVGLVVYRLCRMLALKLGTSTHVS